MPPKKRRAATSIDLSTYALTDEEREEIELSLPPTKKLQEGRKYIKRPNFRRKEYWDNFLEYYEGEDEIRAECKFCPATYSCDGNNAGSKNVKNHASRCSQNPANKLKGNQSFLNFQPGFDSSMSEAGPAGQLSYVNVNLTEVREAIVEMIVLEELSFRFAESKGFVKVMKVACPKYTCCSRFTIARDIVKLYKSERDMLKGVFRDSCQRFSITTDTWTSNQKLNYMCITAHFIDNEWNLQKRVINFCPITSHRGKDIGKGIEECLISWGIDNKLFTVTVDNAGSNNTACAYLQKMVERSGGISNGKYIHMRCMAHIINLIVWDGIKEQHISIGRIRNAVKYIRNSPSRFQRLKELGARLNIDTKALLSQDCPTRWNSTYEMLNAAFKLRLAVDGIELPPSEKTDEQAITSDDWAKVGNLVVFLEGFYDLTTNISGALYLTSNQGLIEISETLSLLNEWSETEDEQMKSMAVSMREKYDKYWGQLSSMNMMTYMGVILDPHARLDIVEGIMDDMFGVEEGGILFENVKRCATDLFEEYRALYSNQSDIPDDPNVPAGDMGRHATRISRFREKMKSKRGIVGSTSISTKTEFERYLSDEIVGQQASLDTLAWWKENASRYPIVSRMARDILAIPISTVASESAFSAGGRQIDQFRSSLNPSTVQALICTQDWIRARDRTVMRDMDKNLRDLEELDERAEEINKDTGEELADDLNLIYIAHP